jgi:hypothetical protein
MELPDDIILYLTSFFPIESVVNAKLSCKKWHSILSTELFWKLLCRNKLGVNSDIPSANTWELEYKKRFEIGTGPHYYNLLNFSGFRDTDTFLLSRLKSVCDGDLSFEDELLSLLKDAFAEQQDFFSHLSTSTHTCTNKHCDIYIRFYQLVGCFRNIGAPRLARILEIAEAVFSSKWNCRDFTLANQFFKQVTRQLLS